MNVKEIIEKYLKEKGYDGLSCRDLYAGSCSCTIATLMHCQDPDTDCQLIRKEKEKK